MSCEECHAEDGAHSLEALGRGERPDVRGCSDCHDSPHAEGFLDALAGEQPGTAGPGDTCSSCHDVAEHGGFDGALETTSPMQHALTGFPLDAPHDEVGCLECHANELAGQHLGFAERYPEIAKHHTFDDLYPTLEDRHGTEADRHFSITLER